MTTATIITTRTPSTIMMISETIKDWKKDSGSQLPFES